MKDMHTRLCEGARVALRSTFRERCMLLSSPWNAYVGAYGGIIVARTDDPENPIPAEWRYVARVRSDASDEQNMVAIRTALERMPLPVAN